MATKLQELTGNVLTALISPALYTLGSVLVWGAATKLRSNFLSTISNLATSAFNNTANREAPLQAAASWATEFKNISLTPSQIGVADWASELQNTGLTPSQINETDPTIKTLVEIALRTGTILNNVIPTPIKYAALFYGTHQAYNYLNKKTPTPFSSQQGEGKVVVIVNGNGTEARHQVVE